MRKPHHTTDPLLVLLTTALVIGLFVLDLWLPLGVADGVLYGSVVLISLTSPQRQFPFIVAGVCSALTVVGAFLGPTLPSVPPWIVVINRALGLIVIWVPPSSFASGDGATKRYVERMASWKSWFSKGLPSCSSPTERWRPR